MIFQIMNKIILARLPVAQKIHDRNPNNVSTLGIVSPENSRKTLLSNTVLARLGDNIKDVSVTVIKYLQKYSSH